MNCLGVEKIAEEGVVVAPLPRIGVYEVFHGCKDTKNRHTCSGAAAPLFPESGSDAASRLRFAGFRAVRFRKEPGGPHTDTAGSGTDAMLPLSTDHPCRSEFRQG